MSLRHDAYDWLIQQSRSAMRLHFPLLVCLAAALSSAVVASPIWSLAFSTLVTGHYMDCGLIKGSSVILPGISTLDLIPEMKKVWPDLLKPSTFHFWKYEWSKHGTCAAEAASLNSQHKYFSKALELYQKVDLNSMLQKANIIPSDKYYTFSDIEQAMENFYGVKPKIQCVHPSMNSESQALGQIEICFDSDFTLQDCEKHFATNTLSRGQWDQNKSSGLS
ncbi:hypothetical protein CCH79_00010505, partial [Gambusia affinis]